jgi:subtilase family serine protease
MIFLLASLGTAGAQIQATQSTETTASRLAGDWRSGGTTVLTGSKPQTSLTGSGEGAAPANTTLNRMLLLLAPSAAQQQALATELTNLEDPSSSSYHQWLTPQAFASAYSNSATDVAAVAAWLESEGFQVAPLPAGRGWIEFSGTVAQTEQAFQVQIDTVATASGPRPVLVGNISVPTALSPLIAGLVSLDGVVSTPPLTVPQPVAVSVAELAGQTSPGGAPALTPQMMAQLLNLSGLSSSGVQGAGETIAIASRSNVNSTDVAAFRAAFGLSALPLTVALNGADPGLTDGQAEATLEASWAGATAPQAQILLVPAATTSATDGVDLSLAAIVDQKLAYVAAVGYSSCEVGLSAAHQAFYSALYQQATAEGIAMIAAAGDSGAAACHAAGSTAPVSTGYGVNALASTPWNTVVGVASFGSTGPTAGHQALAAWSPLSAADPSYASGGGNSTLYKNPSWQPIPAQLAAGTNGTGIHNRLLPDLALPTAIDTGSNPGLAFCLSATPPSSGCTLVRSGGSAAAASLFAGIAALVDEEHGTQGNLASGLYTLSGHSGVYSDVAQGSAQLPCTAGSTGCGTSGQIGYTAGTGYDLTTGLGVPDAKALVTAFASPESNGVGAATATNTTVTGQTINPSGSVVLSATVTSGTGGGPPTGSVTFYDESKSANIVTVILSANSGNSSAVSVTVTGVLTAGTHNIQAQYSGDSTYAAVNSGVVTVTSAQSSTTTAMTPATAFPLTGSSLIVTAVVTSANAGTGALAPSGTVNFEMDGVSQGSGALVAGSASGASTNSSASFNMTVPATTGAHQIVGVYIGDTNYITSTSPGSAITVTAVTPTVFLTVTPPQPPPGSSVTYSVTITPPGPGATPTGSVIFTVDGTAVGTEPVIPGTPSTASLTIAAPLAGNHSVQATYSGDNNYSTAMSQVVSVDVAKTSTTLALNPTTTTPAVGSSLQVTATITPSAYDASNPSGTVTFTLDGALEGVENVVPGVPSTASVTFTVPSAGQHNLQATYSGDTSYATSTAIAVPLNVSKSTPTVAVTTTPLSPAVGSSLQLTATISPPLTGATAPSGSVNFLLNGNSVGTGLVVAGLPSTATVTISTPAVGSYTLQAVYSGDGNYNTASSLQGSILVSKGATTLAVTPATTAPLGGSSMLVTATLTGYVSGTVVPTGTVSFTLDGNAAGSASLAGGTTASVTITVPVTGMHSLQASYTGDTNYIGSVSPAAPFTVAKTPTTSVVLPSTTTPVLGATLPVSVDITPSVQGATQPSGTVTFIVDGVATNVVPVTQGTPFSTASYTFPAMTPGTHTVAATYSGDTYYATSTATAVTVTVPKSPTTMSMVPATLTPSGGSSLAVSATITATNPGTSPPTGTVTYTLDGTAVGSSAVVPSTPSTSSVVLPAMTPGSHILQATYSGDSYYSSSTAQASTLTVSKSPTAISISPSTLTPTAGGSMTVTAYITSSSPATVLPSGTVTITVDGTAEATATVVPGSPSTAVVTLPLVSAGSHILEGTYSGDTYYTGSNSPTVAIVAAKGTTVTALTATPTSLTAGTAETLTATIATTNPVANTTYTFTGTVSFYDKGTTLLGTVVVTNNAATLTGVKLADNVSHTITAIYSGDINWLGSTSTAYPLAATTLPDIVVLTSNFTTVQPGVAVVLTATVTPTSTPTTTGEQNPTGNVIFYDGTTVVGIAALTPVTLTDSSTATLTIQTLPGGQDTISAYYEGDLYYDAATSNLLSLTIEAFTITPASTNSPTNLTIVQGAAGAASFVITGEGGFNNEVQIVCAVPSQDNMTCTASPQQLTPTATVTFVVQTFTMSSLSASTQTGPGKPGTLWPRAAGGAALAGLLFFLLPFGKRARIFVRQTPRRWLVLLLLLVGLGTSGIGCTNNQALSANGTPLGVSTLKITASAYVDNAVVSQSVYLTVNVVTPGTVTP